MKTRIKKVVGIILLLPIPAMLLIISYYNIYKKVNDFEIALLILVIVTVFIAIIVTSTIIGVILLIND